MINAIPISLFKSLKISWRFITKPFIVKKINIICLVITFLQMAMRNFVKLLLRITMLPSLLLFFCEMREIFPEKEIFFQCNSECFFVSLLCFVIVLWRSTTFFHLLVHNYFLDFFKRVWEWLNTALKQQTWRRHVTVVLL